MAESPVIRDYRPYFLIFARLVAIIARKSVKSPDSSRKSPVNRDFRPIPLRGPKGRKNSIDIEM